MYKFYKTNLKTRLIRNFIYRYYTDKFIQATREEAHESKNCNDNDI